MYLYMYVHKLRSKYKIFPGECIVFQIKIPAFTLNNDNMLFNLNSHNIYNNDSIVCTIHKQTMKYFVHSFNFC